METFWSWFAWCGRCKEDKCEAANQITQPCIVDSGEIQFEFVRVPKDPAVVQGVLSSRRSQVSQGGKPRIPTADAYSEMDGIRQPFKSPQLSTRSNTGGTEGSEWLSPE